MIDVMMWWRFGYMGRWSVEMVVASVDAASVDENEIMIVKPSLVSC